MCPPMCPYVRTYRRTYIRTYVRIFKIISHAENMPETCRKHAENMPKACRNLVETLSKTLPQQCRNTAESLPKHCRNTDSSCQQKKNAIFLRFVLIVPGFFRIWTWVEKHLGRSEKVAKKWHLFFRFFCSRTLKICFAVPCGLWKSVLQFRADLKFSPSGLAAENRPARPAGGRPAGRWKFVFSYVRWKLWTAVYPSNIAPILMILY